MSAGERGASTLGLIVVVALIAVAGFVVLRLIGAGNVKGELEKEAADYADRAINGESPEKLRSELVAAANGKACQATADSVKIGLDPPGKPTRVTVVLECKLPLDFFLFKVNRAINIVKTRERSGAYKLMENIREKLEGAQRRHDEQVDRRAGIE